VVRNTFIGNISEGSQALTTSGEFSVCLHLSINSGSNPGYLFNWTGGTIKVENFANFSSNNSGTVSTVGTITDVSQGTCNCP
jgi:hypothetical protein